MIGVYDGVKVVENKSVCFSRRGVLIPRKAAMRPIDNVSESVSTKMNRVENFFRQFPLSRANQAVVFRESH